MEISWNSYVAAKNAREAGAKKKVQYFNSLKNDGDETLVRFVYNSADDFKVVQIHRVPDGKRFVNVACVRGQYESKDTCGCPLCKAKEGDKYLYPAKVKTFLNVLEYTKDEEGNIVATPRVWERPAAIIDEILGAFNDGVSNLLYPKNTPICDVVFKIRRTGTGLGDTKYHIASGNPAVYPETSYSKDFSSFEGFDASQLSYYKKSTAEMDEYVANKHFPESAKESTDAKITKPQGAINTTITAPKYDDVVNTNTAAPVEPVPMRQVQPSTQVQKSTTEETLQAPIRRYPL